MESLIKQTWVKFNARQENKPEGSSARDRSPPQKTPSFREKRRNQSWIRRQFSRQMSSDYDLSNAEYPTAVAAAAYAIHSLENSRARDYRDETSRPDRSVNRVKSRSEDIINPPEPRKSALKSSDESSRKSFKDPDMSTSQKKPEKKRSHKKKLSFSDAVETFGSPPETTEAEKFPQRTPSFGSPSSFPDENLNIGEGNRAETTEMKPIRPPTPLPRGQVQPIDTLNDNIGRKPGPRDPQADAWEKEEMTRARVKASDTNIGRRPGPEDTQADAWEKEEMASIKERYEKMKDTIDKWEMKQKSKAKRKIEKIENMNYDQAELEKRRVKAAESYRSELIRIEGIAAGARAQAEENRRSEEYKVREKANKIRSTGKLPPTCFCF